MGRNPRSVIALILGCLLLVGCAAIEKAPQQQPNPSPHHAVHASTQSR
jgi:PBP1b-binding outer membrane lipoprotein LpoB